MANYTRQLLDRLSRLDTKNEYVLFALSHKVFRTTNPRWRVVDVKGFGPLLIRLQLLLPHLAAAYGVEVFWAPRQICPVFCRRSTAVVTTVHDFVHILHPGTMPLRLVPQYRVLVPASLARSDILVPVSAKVRSETLQFYPEIEPSRTIAVPNGAPDWTVPAEYSQAERGQHLLFVGSLEPRKNLLVLVEALEALMDRGLHVALHLVGPPGWANRRLHSHIQRSRARELITFRGRLPVAQLKDEYLKCKALVYPSLYEGFGLPVLEALSLDCLVLTSKGTVMQEIAGDSAVYFDPHSVESIANAIARVYAADFDRTRYLSRADAVVQEYSWDRSARRLLQLFGDAYEYRQSRRSAR